VPPFMLRKIQTPLGPGKSRNRKLENLKSIWTVTAFGRNKTPLLIRLFSVPQEIEESNR